MNIILLTCSLIIISILYSVIIETRKERKFIRNINVGTRLQITYPPYDEFSEHVTFNITIIKKGKNQVRVRYNDGSESTMDISTMYDNGWKIIN